MDESEEVLFSPIIDLECEIRVVMRSLVRTKIDAMPADEVKALILDLIDKRAISGLAEPLGIEARTARLLRATLESLREHP